MMRSKMQTGLLASLLLAGAASAAPPGPDEAASSQASQIQPAAPALSLQLSEAQLSLLIPDLPFEAPAADDPDDAADAAPAAVDAIPAETPDSSPI